MFTRRQFALAAAALATTGTRASAESWRPDAGPKLILAPSNLGLRPTPGGGQPGTWRAPEALMAAGLKDRLGSEEVVALKRPSYEFDAQPGTRIRNGLTIRRFSLELSRLVRAACDAGDFSIVIGGDCSVLLGCLYGARIAGGKGLVHVDGHSDFSHPGNYDTAAVLGAVAGMDLALATGRGEPLLTEWPEVDGPLARDEDTIQIGERNALDANYDQYYGPIRRTKITRMIVQDVLRDGVEKATEAAVERLRIRSLDRVWLHVDLDVLDQSVMPAVDSPGSPGFDFAQLGDLLGMLLQSGRFIGAGIAIYDPELDPDARYAAKLVTMLGRAFARV
jgi:arginase